jgi:hypothetical protein
MRPSDIDRAKTELTDDEAYGCSNKLQRRVRQHYNEAKHLSQFPKDFQMEFINKLLAKGERERGDNIAAFLGLTRSKIARLGGLARAAQIKEARRHEKGLQQAADDLCSRLGKPGQVGGEQQQQQ